MIFFELFYNGMIYTKKDINLEKNENRKICFSEKYPKRELEKNIDKILVYLMKLKIILLSYFVVEKGIC
jgi:hypothetical protein